MRTVGEVGQVGVRVADIHPHAAPELVLNGHGRVVFTQQPAVLEDQVHEPREEKAIVLFIDPWRS
jgi:hypothetical protein